MEINIAHLSKHYKSIQALEDVSLQLPGGMFGLLGPNGAGKTTLMRILATLIPLSSGSVKVGEFDVARQPQEVRRVLGYIPQSFGFYKQLNAIEQLDYIATMKNLPTQGRREKILDVLDKTDLVTVARRKVGTYSGGMKQRLGIAQAILGDPELIIVDEPTAGLDPEERVRFRNLFAGLAENKTVILSTHIVADVEASCTALAVLSTGKLIYFGSAQAIVERARGKVWSKTIPVRAFTAFEQNHQVVSSRQNGDQLTVRMLSDTAPSADADPCEPALEDGYLVLLSEQRQGVRHG